MAALSLQQLSVSHELLKANKAGYTIRFDKLSATKKLVPYLTKNISSIKNEFSYLSFILI